MPPNVVEPAWLTVRTVGTPLEVELRSVIVPATAAQGGDADRIGVQVQRAAVGDKSADAQSGGTAPSILTTSVSKWPGSRLTRKTLMCALLCRVPALKIRLQIAGSAESVTVQGAASDLLENDPTFHTDVDRSLFDKLPLEESSSCVEFLVTLASPGVAADSNGLFHGMGDHVQLIPGWPAHHRSAKQGIFQPDSARRRAVDDGDLGCSPR